MNKNKIGVLAAVLLSTLVVGVYAGMTLSNHITASWHVTNTGTELTLSWEPSPDGSNFATGVWYGNYGVRLQNTGTATYHVLVYFDITAGAGLPQDCVDIQYWDGADWLDLPMTGWTTAHLSGYFGPPGGFDCTPGWNQLTLLHVMFDGDAPITGYSINAYVAAVP
ncbi:hypothetical protein MUO69_01285 [Candidatus Bathyarchaeota archaeon]|jgi:hypothetical protein|nr:hypothetical protein [Candidatus Bathyarchaeota archaeon]